MVLNDSLNWSDHVHSIQEKLAKRLGMLKRIKHLLPLHLRKVIVNSSIVPLFDYGDIIWGDRNNICLMKKLQTMHNDVAKTILNLPFYSSSTEAQTLLKWNSLKKRRAFHRACFCFKSVDNVIDFNLT